LLQSSQMAKSYCPSPFPQLEKAYNILAFSIIWKISVPGSAIGQFNRNAKFFDTIQQARVRRW
jgi:hypothetical protein